MRIISRKTLRRIQEKHPEARGPLDAWYAEARRARWKNMQDIKERYATASVLNSERVVFNIHGNDFRLVVLIRFPTSTIYIRFIGTHREYDSIDSLRV